MKTAIIGFCRYFSSMACRILYLGRVAFEKSINNNIYYTLLQRFTSQLHYWHECWSFWYNIFIFVQKIKNFFYTLPYIWGSGMNSISLQSKHSFTGICFLITCSIYTDILLHICFKLKHKYLAFNRFTY